MFALFHTQYNYTMNLINFEDQFRMFKIRWYEHPTIYTFMSFFAVSRSKYRARNSIVKTIKILLKAQRRSSFSLPFNFLENFVLPYIYIVILYRYYYRHYMYIIMNFTDNNGWALRYSQPQNLYFLIMLFSGVKLNYKFVGYNVNKFNEFFIYLNSLKKKLVPKLNLYPKRKNWLRDRDLMYKQQTYYRYNETYKMFFNMEFTFNPEIISIPMTVPSNIRFIFKISEKWLTKVKQKFVIKFGVSDITKNIKYKNLKKFIIYYIRKNKVFNKSRYSRNRQLYRTGVYWCLWLNIMIVYGLYFFFYRFAFTFGYLGLGLILLASSFLVARASQCKFYNPIKLFEEFNALFLWFSLLLGGVFKNFYFYIENILNYFLLIINSNKKITFTFIIIIENLYNLICKFQYQYQLKRFEHFYYIWIPFQGEDTSFLKWRSILHWFTQFYKMLRA